MGIFGPRGIIWINLVEGPQGDATYQRPCGFRQEDFFIFSYLAYVNHVTLGLDHFSPQDII